MTYPQTIPDFRAAVLAYQPDTDIEEAFYAAQGEASPVVMCVRVFDLLAPAADLDQDGLKLLLGAAHLIAAGGWHGKAGDAATVLATRSADLKP